MVSCATSKSLSNHETVNESSYAESEYERGAENANSCGSVG
jgi:hypothetical protein